MLQPLCLYRRVRAEEKIGVYKMQGNEDMLQKLVYVQHFQCRGLQEKQGQKGPGWAQIQESMGGRTKRRGSQGHSEFWILTHSTAWHTPSPPRDMFLFLQLACVVYLSNGSFVGMILQVTWKIYWQQLVSGPWPPSLPFFIVRKKFQAAFEHPSLLSLCGKEIVKFRWKYSFCRR